MTEENMETYFEKGFESSSEFFKRLNGNLDFKDKVVMDVGSGFGSTCFYMAQNGAKRVVGVEINPEALAFARSKLKKYPQAPVEFKLPSEVSADERFDLIISKDSFEHYDNPEEFILTLKGLLKPDGILCIGFSPLWKSPYGAHITSLTRLPWVHLMFPERVLIRELKGYIPSKKIESFKDVAGGLNKMTLKRYIKIVDNAGLEFKHFRTNVTSNRKSKFIFSVFRVLCMAPPIRQYFTVNVYSILRIKKVTK
jgi:SAM-dependent methyltransferase